LKSSELRTRKKPKKINNYFFNLFLSFQET
jgi:hypothetical protein